MKELEAELLALKLGGKGKYYQLPESLTKIAFSGGRTSGYMLRHILDSNNGLPAATKVLFANTGKEKEQTLEFVNECSLRWAVPITWVEYRRAPEGGESPHTFEVVTFETASRDGRPFNELLMHRKMLPNVRVRSCSGELKVRTMKRYLQSIGWESWTDVIGIRADEEDRTFDVGSDCPSYITPTFPMVKARVYEDEVMRFWKEQPFDLQLRQDQGNCDFCFLKSRGKIERLIREDPEGVNWWIDKEKSFEVIADTPQGARFRIDRPSYAALLKESKNPQLFDNDEDIPCGCVKSLSANDDDGDE